MRRRMAPGQGALNVNRCVSLLVVHPVGGRVVGVRWGLVQAAHARLRSVRKGPHHLLRGTKHVNTLLE